MATCDKCGAMNDAANEFCQNCGASLRMTSLPPRAQAESQKSLLSKIERSIYFRIARGFAWCLLVFSLLSLVVAAFIAANAAREYFKGEEAVSKEDVKVAIAADKARRASGARSEASQVARLDPKAEGMLATEIAELFNLLSLEDQGKVGGKENFRNKMLEIASRVKGTNNVHGQIEILREVNKVVSEVLPQSDRLQAIEFFFDLKANSVNRAESRKAAAMANLMYSGGAVFSAAALITLLTMVLVLLAIDRNTRKE